MTSQPTYDAFLSYNSLDHAIVERVAKELGSRRCECFVDRWYLQPGQDWVAALERALTGSKSVAMFIGPHEMGRWQQREREWALDRQAGADDFPVIPVLLPGCEPPLGSMKQLMWSVQRNDPADPSQLDALAAAIRGEKVDRDAKPEPRAMICPYRGLLAFREEDAEFFFGRDAYLKQLVGLVERQTLVAVVGASGSGKSSLVGAGLVPELRRLGDGPVWDVVRMVPNVDPLYSLAEALVPLIEPDLSRLSFERELSAVANDLAQEEPTTPLWGLANAALRQQPGTERLLLFVDQWEELYTNCEKPSRRERFIKQLLEATARNDSPLSVVLTVRGNFYNEILNDRLLLDRIENARLDLGPMNRDELHSVIEGPAKNVGLTFQDGLVERILDDAGQEPGRLALLEFALEELWKRRDRLLLTHTGYEDLGRQPGQQAQDDTVTTTDCLSRAIATYADGVYDELDPEEQETLPPLFRRLVRAGSRAEEDTRRRALLSDLSPTSQRVARKLADKRLLITTLSGVVEWSTEKPDYSRLNEPGGYDVVPDAYEPPRTTVEVAHEELLRSWGRLKGWVDEDRKFLLWRSRLDLRVEQFQQDGASALFRDNPLQDANEFYPARREALDGRQRCFLDASIDADHKQQEAERRRQESDQRLRTVIRSAIAAVIVAGLCAAWWINDSQQRTNALFLLETYVDAPAERVADDFVAMVKPYRRYLLDPLHRVFTEGRRADLERLNAAYALARLDDMRPEELRILLQAIPDANPEHRERNFDLALRSIGNRQLKEEVLVELATDGGFRFALTGLRHGFTGPATICTQFDADPTDRTDFIHRWDEWPADMDTLIGLLKDTKTGDGLRSALCCVIGLHFEDKAWVENRDRLIPLLTNAHKTAAEPGLHFTAEWALRKWNAVPESGIEARMGNWEPHVAVKSVKLAPLERWEFATTRAWIWSNSDRMSRRGRWDSIGWSS